MTINEINDAEIREYILGQSRDDQTELLDELSFFDEYSERFGVVEREIIDDYLTGHLSSDEKLAFESHYLTSPIRREKLDFAKALADYTKQQTPVVPVAGNEGTIFDVFRTWRLAFQFGAAVLVILLGIAGWIAFRISSPTEIAQSSSTDPAPYEHSNTVLVTPATPLPSPAATIFPAETPANENQTSRARPVVTPTPRPPKPIERRTSVAFFLLTPALRSSSFQELKMPTGATTAELRLLLETEEKGPFRIEVLDLRRRSRVWSASNLTPRKGGAGSMISFRIPARVLGPGEYQISVSRAETGDDSEKIGDYFLMVAP